MEWTLKGLDVRYGDTEGIMTAFTWASRIFVRSMLSGVDRAGEKRQSHPDNTARSYLASFAVLVGVPKGYAVINFTRVPINKILTSISM